MACEIARRGELTRQVCRDAADWTAKALDGQPGLMLMALVGGFEDDPREVLDIPEARQAFAWFGERLREMDEADGDPRLLNRLESVTRGLVMVAMGLLPRTAVRIGAEYRPEVARQWQADVERVRASDAAYRAAQAARAAKGRPQ
jgi:hypothetical protein